MTIKQLDLYNKLRIKLRRLGIKNIPTGLKVKDLDSQKSFMLVKVLSEELKNLNAWEYSSAFRQTCFIKYGYDFVIYTQVEDEIKKVLTYCEK